MLTEQEMKEAAEIFRVKGLPLVKELSPEMAELYSDMVKLYCSIKSQENNIKEQKDKLSELVKQCTHPLVVRETKNRSSTGHWDRSDDYWTNHKCNLCGKQWITDQDWKQKGEGLPNAEPE